MSASLAAHADIAVLGAGSWGTALAIQCARAGRPARLWGRDRAHMEIMMRERRNTRYLPGAPFPDSLHLMADLEAVIDGVDDVLLAVPSHGFRALLQQLKPRERQLLWLAYVEGMTHSEIAKCTGLRSMSVRILLFRARQKAAELLGRKERAVHEV